MMRSRRIPQWPMRVRCNISVRDSSCGDVGIGLSVASEIAMSLARAATA
jgi:hypothetical protein